MVPGSPPTIDFSIEGYNPIGYDGTNGINAGDKVILTASSSTDDVSTITWQWILIGTFITTTPYVASAYTTGSPLVEPLLEINSDETIGGQVYTFMLVGTKNAASSNVTKSVTANAGPCCGTVTAENNNINSAWYLNTWTVSASASPTLSNPFIQYLFQSYSSTAGSYVPLGSLIVSPTATYTSSFPPGDNLIRVTAYDALNAAYNIDFTFYVNNTEITDVSGAIGAITGGSIGSMVANIGAVADSITNQTQKDDLANAALNAMASTASSQGSIDPSTALAFCSVLLAVGAGSGNSSSTADASVARIFLPL